MWLRVLFLFLGVVCWVGRVEAGEHILVSGGCALRFFERSKEFPHDKYWGNFIDSAQARIEQIRSEVKRGDTLTWMVYRPAYVARGREEEQDLVGEIAKRVEREHAKLVWFDNRDELLAYLNEPRSGEGKIVRFEYFGHSNKRTFMFDYSNLLDGSSTEPGTLHMSRLKELRRDNFGDDAYCKSWGCHSGEEYSAVWRRATGEAMIGAIGKTDYSKGGVPVLSTSKGRWSR